MKNNKILEVKNLSKVFSQKGSLLVAVDNVSFDLEKGETIGLIGESGSGKTTIGRTIIKLHNPSSGRILINKTDVAGKKITKEEEKILRTNIQMIFQDPYSSLNEQKNIMNIVSEPIKVLKLDKKYINDLYQESEKVYKFFGFTLIDYFYEKMFEFRKFANNIANNTYKKIINNLEVITFNQNKKEENLKLLLSNYFKLKQKANFDIINKMLSISNDVFILWRECQAKIKKGDLDLELEKKLLNSMLEYKNALDNSKFSKKYIKLKKEVEDIKKEKQSFEEFVNKIKYSSQKNIKNVILEWENNRRIKLLNSKKTQTFSDYNFVYLDYLIVRKICYILKALKNSNVLFDGNISEKTEKLYNSLKEELKDKFEEFKNINNKSIKSEIKDIENIDEKVNYICTNFKNNFLLKENNTEYIYNVFLEKHSTLNISNLQELKKLLEIKIRDRDLEKNKNVETLISEEELQKFKEKYEAAEKADQDDLTNFKIEHNLKIQLIEQERTNILTEQNKLLDKNRIKSKNLFSSRLNELFNLKLNNNFKENVLFKKHALKEMKIMEKNNASLEKEMNKIQKDLNVIKAFITKSNNVKLKIKKMLVRNKVFKALEDSGLTKAHAFRYPHEFSGGMRQRVGIARAIITEPKIIIADEPIAALDLSIQAQIINMLKNLQKRYNMSMIFIAHDLSMVRYISDKILIIHLGKIVEHGKTEEIFKNPIHPYTKNLLSSMPDISKISKGFQDENFEPKYLEKYSSINVPKYYDITETHKVLADKEQIKKWKNEINTKK